MEFHDKTFTSETHENLVPNIVKPKSEVPKSKVPKSRPKGLGLTLKSHGPPPHPPTHPPTPNF